MLDQLEAGNIVASEIDPARIKRLEDHSDATVRQRAKQAAAKFAVSARTDVLADYQHALTMAGDIERGRIAFRKTCSACHRLEGAGHEIGPNLAAIKTRGAETILLNILDPNREVNPQFVNYIAVTSDGRTLTGIIVDETAASVKLKRAENATNTVLRTELEQLRSTGQSIMPEGLEKQVDVPTMADIISYLMAVK